LTGFAVPVNRHGAGSEADNHKLVFTLIRDVILDSEVEVIVDESVLASALLANTESVATEEFILLILGKIDAFAKVDERTVVESGKVINDEVTAVISFDELLENLKLVDREHLVVLTLEDFTLLILLHFECVGRCLKAITHQDLAERFLVGLDNWRAAKGSDIVAVRSDTTKTVKAVG
jgi:hypothetical protein